jgi:hypothetical protein
MCLLHASLAQLQARLQSTANMATINGNRLIRLIVFFVVVFFFAQGTIRSGF